MKILYILIVVFSAISFIGCSSNMIYQDAASDGCSVATCEDLYIQE